VALVRCKAAEEKFLSEGFGVKRYPVMYSEFMLIGPAIPLASTARTS
jgi:tungstate transport system substrate-binding protein